MRPDAPPIPYRPAFRRAARAAIVVAAILLGALLLLWIDRKPIAEGYIARTLAAAGVPARYTLAALGPGHQRLTNVVIGDPARPDLVADWIETETAIGFGGARVTGLRVGHVRLRGTVVRGRVSLGTIDRLLPAGSGQRFALPAIYVAIADARMRLATQAGVVGVKIAGSGRLDDGFRGTVAAVSDRMAAAGCAGTQVAAALRVVTIAGRPTLRGPVRVGGIACADGRAGGIAADLDTTLTADLSRWTGRAVLTTGRLDATGYAAQRAHGDVSFDGTAAQTRGRVAVSLIAPREGSMGAGRVAVAGAYRVGGTRAFDGTVTVANVLRRGGEKGWGTALETAIASAISGVTGTPIAPLVAASGHAVTAAARDVSVTAKVALAWAHGQGVVRVEAARLASASGARAALSGGDGVRIDIAKRAVTIDGDLAVAGGGVPGIRASLHQAKADDPVRGTATVDPYAAGGARLTLTPVAFVAGRGGTRVSTRATLSGPVGSGRVAGLTIPIDARWGAAGLLVDDRCTVIGFDRLMLSGFVLGSVRTALCPVDGALVHVAGGRVGGGAALAAVRVAGTLGGSPFSLVTDKAVLRMAGGGFAVDGVHALLGPSDRRTQLDFGQLSGTATGGGVAGRFAGGAGTIADVPLALSAAAGDWRIAGKVLSLRGTLGVADVDKDARFKPLSARGVVLTLANGRIDATGTLYEPTRGVKVADVAIRHDLSAGAGTADLTVPALAFTDTFQPDLLTPLTYGVIAAVKGDIAGAGHVAWSRTGVTSTGRFRTGALDLAAAFGPVTGLAGEIVFTDLLSLQSAPGQVATVRTINPGIAVNDGRIVYQTLPGSRIVVDSARWPFAGGALTLDPTLLDFAPPVERRITLRVDGAAADQFLLQFDFKNLNATGVFDGVLPMIFNESGGRIERGTLTVRGGGGGIAYVGEIGQKDLGFWGDLAFQALKSLRYQRLSITMNGPLSGEMVTAVRFAGVSQGAGAKADFLVRRLQRLPFVFNVTIRAPFRGLLDSAASFYDPRRLIERNLPTLIEEQEKQAAPQSSSVPAPIQPPASRTVP
ncbi:YdbH domain-containing protein [Sphingomonas bacterium]|uniref:intermembrane phospholipid transport protein YdbH family protein n=1 Tax=Sphingomonas bacterium TaxID=1895847 RepID=UPI0015763A24|nr:YdbH domain-containing protein [Sphingomonas bacterium]